MWGFLQFKVWTRHNFKPPWTIKFAHEGPPVVSVNGDFEQQLSFNVFSCVIYLCITQPYPKKLTNTAWVTGSLWVKRGKRELFDFKQKGIELLTHRALKDWEKFCVFESELHFYFYFPFFEIQGSVLLSIHIIWLHNEMNM